MLHKTFLQLTFWYFMLPRGTNASCKKFENCRHYYKTLQAYARMYAGIIIQKLELSGYYWQHRCSFLDVQRWDHSNEVWKFDINRKAELSSKNLCDFFKRVFFWGYPNEMAQDMNKLVYINSNRLNVCTMSGDNDIFMSWRNTFRAGKGDDWRKVFRWFLLTLWVHLKL